MSDIQPHDNASRPPAGAAASTPKSAVPGEFDRVALGYDRLTGINPGYRHHLRLSAARLQLRPGARILDLCCGTGLSTLALRAVYPSSTIVGLDAAAEMLDIARSRAELHDVRWVHGDATDPRAAGVDGTFDGILMAYGIRNIAEPDRCLHNLHGLLAPGAPVCFHEYSVAGSRWSTGVWKAVASCIIIPSARLVTGDTTLFRYLRQSVLEFDSVAAFQQRLTRTGYAEVQTLPMNGWQRGIVHSFLARRASDDAHGSAAARR